MDYDVSTVIDRTDQIGCRQGVVDNKGNARTPCDCRNRLDIRDGTTRVSNRLNENRFGFLRDSSLKAFDVIGIRPHHVPAEILEGVIELVDRATIQLARSNEFVAWLQ